LRARPARSFISAEIADSVFVSARRITGVNSPPSIATATATSECLTSDAVLGPHAFASGTRWSANASALMTKSLTESLNPGFAVLVLRHARVDLLAEREKGVQLDVERQVEMGNGLLRLDEAASPPSCACRRAAPPRAPRSNIALTWSSVGRSPSHRPSGGFGSGRGLAAGAAVGWAAAGAPALGRSLAAAACTSAGRCGRAGRTLNPGEVDAASFARRRASGDAKMRPPDFAAPFGFEAAAQARPPRSRPASPDRPGL
jgi:hypothetical protein